MTFSVKPTINVGDDSIKILNSLNPNKIFFCNRSICSRK